MPPVTRWVQLRGLSCDVCLASTQKAAADTLIWATWSHSATPPPVDGKIAQPLLLLVMGCRRPEVLRALGGRKSVCRRPARPDHHAHLWHKKQLRVGAARWICSGYPPEGSAWLGHYNRMLLTPARCAELPPAARGSGRPESLPKRATTRRWSAVMTPRDAGLRADDAVTSHRAADGAVPSIEGARTYAHFISRGAMAGFAAFLSAMTNSPLFLYTESHTDSTGGT